MSLLSTLSSLQAPALLVLTIFGPSILPRVLAFLTRRGRPPSSSTGPPAPRRPRAPLPLSGKVLLLLHASYFLVALLFPPYDIFTSHNLPITAPHDALRRAALRHPTSALHPSVLGQSRDDPLDLLLGKLTNIDNRILYARYGHQPFLDCTWCKDVNDYALAALPGMIAPYLVELGVLGVLGWAWVGGAQARERAERWRGDFGWGVGGTLLLDVGARHLWDIRPVEGDCLHLAPTLHTIRSILLLLLPLIYVFIPPPSSPLHLSALLPALSNTQSTLRLTSLSRIALARSPTLRASSIVAGEAAQREAEAARRDSGVMSLAADLRLEEEVQRGGGQWIREGWRGMVRVDPGGATHS